MKLHLENPKDKERRLAQWHEWFAWYPVKIEGHGWHWLEVIQRKIAYGLAKDGCGKGRKYLPRFSSSYDNPDVSTRDMWI